MAEVSSIVLLLAATVIALLAVGATIVLLVREFRRPAPRKPEARSAEELEAEPTRVTERRARNAEKATSVDEPTQSAAADGAEDPTQVLTKPDKE